MRAGDHAYQTLLDEIQSGTLAPGTVLAEVEQSERLGVSRTPLREALARLAADRLVEQASPRVTVVTAIDADDIRALFTLRRALEETAARLAASSAQADPGCRSLFADLAQAFENTTLDLSHDSGQDAYYALIGEFDGALDNVSENEYLSAALRTVRTHLVRVRRLARQHPDRLIASVAEHALIARAISVGDADLAAHATHVHLHNAVTSILASLQAEHAQLAGQNARTTLFTPQQGAA